MRSFVKIMRMYVKTFSAVLRGLEADMIGIEIDVSKGLPAFQIVGLAGKSINEAKERVSVALKSCDFPLAPQRILINLSPAHIRKEGPHLDLGIAAGLMFAFEYLQCSAELLEQCCFIGELSLTGEIRPAVGILPLALEVQDRGKACKYLIIPANNRDEASLVTLRQNSSLKIFFVSTLSDLKVLLNLLGQGGELAGGELKTFQIEGLSPNRLTAFFALRRKPASKKLLEGIVGQNQAKRALEIAAAGRHHLLMIGPPGCGKSMLAERLPGLLPDLDFEQALVSTKIYSVSGLLQEPIILAAPFRAPHHSITATALIGGGVPIKPGEVSFAHNGVLFLDEFTEFDRFTIEQLRQILEHKEIVLNKKHQVFTYPADFQLIAACNPSPSGHFTDQDSSSPKQIQRYLSKLSGPILDRIDIHLELSKLDKEEMKLLSQDRQVSANDEFSTEQVRKRVQMCREFARDYAAQFDNNRGLPLQLNQETKDFLDEAVYSLGLSARAHSKVLRLARTIATLGLSEYISIEDIAEALQYRSLNFEKFFKPRLAFVP
jgi:magnesium chelatase family protein